MRRLDKNIKKMKREETIIRREKINKDKTEEMHFTQKNRKKTRNRKEEKNWRLKMRDKIGIK